MPETLRRTLRWLRRFRHRCGYGIHSPFAFTFVTDVVYERTAYYAYAPLRDRRRDHLCPLREKDDRLLLRLINAVRPATAVAAADRLGLTAEYLRAGCRACRLLTLEPAAADIAKIPVIDFLYLDTSADAWPAIWEKASERLGQKACIAVRGIRRTPRDRAAWQRLTADAACRVTFDLHDFGIAFFEARLVKQDYLINYF